MESDGSFCSYYTNIETWCVHSNGRRMDRVEMQTDGNLVMYDSNGRSFWSTGTWQYRGQNPNLMIKDDANMQIRTGNNNEVVRWESKVGRFSSVVFRNSGQKDRGELQLAPLVVYPLLMNLDANAQVWNGKDAGVAPIQASDKWPYGMRTIDFTTVKTKIVSWSWRSGVVVVDDPNQTILKQPVHIGFYQEYGDNQWVNDWRFIYDPKCTALVYVSKWGGFHSGYAQYGGYIAGGDI